MTTVSHTDIAGMLIPASPELPAPLAFTALSLHDTEGLQIAAHRLHINRGKRGVPFWQDWCYLPVNVATALILDTEASAQSPLHHGSDNERTRFTHDFACAAAWNLGKGVYRLDPPYLEGLWKAPCAAALPVGDLLALPEWCIYVECAGRVGIGEHAIEGFFAFLDDRFSGTERFWPELQIVALLRHERYYLSLKYFVPLVRGKTLVETLDLLAQRAEANGAAPIPEATLDLAADDYGETVGAFVTVLAHINGYCREMKRLKAFEHLPRRKKIAFDANGLPVREPHRQLWEMGCPASAPAAIH